MIAKLTPLAPALFDRVVPTARAYQLRYLARRAVSDCDGASAVALMTASLRHSLRPLVEEPVKTTTTLVATAVLALGGQRVMASLLTLKAAKP